MAFFQLVLKAQRLEKARQRYEDEKLRSIEISKGAKPHYTLSQRIRRKKLRCKKRIKTFWSRITIFPKDSWLRKKAVLLRTSGTFENYILKSFFGFFGGVFLTYLFFVFFVFQLNFTLSSATLLCSLLGIILTLGLAFSFRVRCLVFLLLPQFFSKRGRQALMAYAFILALTGPAKNTLHNTGVLSESLACGQEQLKQAIKNVVDLIKQPFYALKDAVSKVIKTVKVVVKKIKETLVAIKRLVLSILKVIKSVFEWLGSVVNICNKKLGTPFDRCQRVFDGAVDDCRAKLGPLFGGICNLTYVVGALCYIVKPLDFICMLVSYVADTVVDAVRKRIKKFTRHMKTMFYVKVKFSHSFHFETNQSKSFEEVSTGIVTEIRSRTDKFLAVFDWMSFATTFFILFMLLRVMHYRHRWLTNERFDNQYITDDLRTIDMIRAKQEKETVLPLNRRERNRYIPLSSVVLIHTERVKLTKSAVFLGLASCKLCIYIMADYSLFWMLSVIRLHGRFQTTVPRSNTVGIYVAGDGYLADLYKSIVKAFTPRMKESEIDTLPCLPDPIPPDLDRYTQIVSLIAFCWLMIIFEPYGLRLRQVVMRAYHPDRAKQRAAWLYNHIIRSRGSFLKFARRQLRRKFGINDDNKIEKVTLKERFIAVCPFLNKLFRQKQDTCILCGTVERSDDDAHIKCPTPGCIGLFCTRCFADLQNLCTICRTPIEYGDLSDMSEEKDSSDDQKLPRMKSEIPKLELETPADERKDLIRKEEGIETKKEDQVEEMKDQKEEEKKKDKAGQVDDKTTEDYVQSSSESVYSYTYQDESPEEPNVSHARKPFKDVEAQRVKDDVTIQIFNEPFVKDVTSDSEGPTSCFVVRARRRLRAKLKRKSCQSPPGEEASTTTSIADTESWPTEEVDEEEVIHIEIGDESTESFLKDRNAERRKRGRVKRIVTALARIPWLGKTKGDAKELQTKKPSLMNRIVSMLGGKQSTLPVQSYRRVRSQGTHEGRRSPSSSSSSSFRGDDENEALLKAEERSTNVQRREAITTSDDTEDNICTSSYESHHCRATFRDPFCRVSTRENWNLKHPCDKRFATKELPRYLELVSKDTSYCEIDETETESQLSVRCIPEEQFNVLSDTKTSSDSRRADYWNIVAGGEIPVPCTVCSLKTDGMRKRKDEIYERSPSDSEDSSTSRNDVGYTDEEGEDRLHSMEEEILSDTETFLQDAPGKRDTVQPITDESDKTLEIPFEYEKTKGEKGTGLEQMTNEKVKDSDAKELRFEKFINASKPRKPEKYELYDPLAGLELYGVSSKPKEKTRFFREDVTKGNTKRLKTKEKQDSKSEKLEFAKEPDELQTPAKMMNKATDLPDKGGNRTKSLSQNREIRKGYRKAIDASEAEGIDTGERKRLRKNIERQRKTSISSAAKNLRRKVAEINSSAHRKDWYQYEERYNDYPERNEARVLSRFQSIRPRIPESSRPDDHICDTNLQRSMRSSEFREYCDDLEFLNPNVQIQSRPPSHDYLEGEICCGSCENDIQRISVQREVNVSSFRNDSGKYECQSQEYEGSTEGFRSYGRQGGIDTTQRRLEVAKLKYLPIYQTPELIEELKEHDRMRLIREREAEGSRRARISRTAEESLLRSRTSVQESSEFSVFCDPSESSSCKHFEKQETLPYQETEAFKEVMCEFRRRAFPRAGFEVSEEAESLIAKPRSTDESKKLRLLFSSENRSRKSNEKSKFRSKILNVFKPMHKKEADRSREECTEFKRQDDVRQNLLRGESSSDTSLVVCDYSSKRDLSEISSSADETTDNNETFL